MSWPLIRPDPALQSAQQDFHKGRLTGSVGPEQAENLSGVDLETDIVERPNLMPPEQIPERFGKTGNLYGVC